ncbi:MAG TPA: 2-oxoglutarate dehydrogenase E1 component, partial [Niabella sp.]|nr:2-oxoglutarate dehydrogenase E1 component [Niabella sp.]
MKNFSYITGSSPEYVENLYKDFVQNPDSVDPELKKFFEGFDFAVDSGFSQKINGEAVAKASETNWEKEIAVYRLIRDYRKKGHLISTTNPIKPRKDRHANLDLEYFGLAESDLKETFQAGNLIGLGATTLQNILHYLQKHYAGNIGFEFTYINDEKKLNWLINEIEKEFFKPVPLSQQKRILEKLNQGVIFEKFLHTKYVGQKRFGLEGGETTIAALDAIINISCDLDVKEVVIGMAHRGRLN